MPTVPPALSEYLDSHTWEESAAVVGREPTLLGDDVISLLNEMEMFYKISRSKKGRTPERIRDHRDALLYCKRCGIDAAFANRRGPKPRTWEELVEQVCFAETVDEILPLVRAYPELIKRDPADLAEAVPGHSLLTVGNVRTTIRLGVIYECRMGAEEAAITRASKLDALATWFQASLGRREPLSLKLDLASSLEVDLDLADHVAGLFLGYSRNPDEQVALAHIRFLLPEWSALGAAQANEMWPLAVHAQVRASLGLGDMSVALAELAATVPAETTMSPLEALRAYYLRGRCFAATPDSDDENAQEEERYETIRSFEAAYRAALKLDLDGVAAHICRGIADAYLRMPIGSDDEARFNLNYAIRWYTRAVEHHRPPTPSERGWVLSGLARAHGGWVGPDRSDHLARAIALAGEALPLLDSTNSSEFARTRALVGAICLDLGQSGDASRLPEAKNHLEAALAACSPVTMPSAWQHILALTGDLLYGERCWAEAAERYRRLDGARAEQDPLWPLEWRSHDVSRHAQFSWCLVQQRRKDEALRVFASGRARAITHSLLNDVRLADLPADTRATYHWRVAALRRALDACERASLVSGERLASIQHDGQFSPIVIHPHHEQPALGTTTRDSAEHHGSLHAQMVNARSDLLLALERLVGPTRASATLERTASEICRSDEAIVIPIVVDEGAAAFVVTTKEVDVVKLKLDLSTLLRWIGHAPPSMMSWSPMAALSAAPPSGYLGAYARRHSDPKVWDRALDEMTVRLGSLFWQPILERLPSSTRALVVIPDGPFWQLPLHAAKIGDDEYLVDRYEVAFACALGHLAAARSDEATCPVGSKALVVTNPTGDLDGTALEDRAVRLVLPDGPSITGMAATRSAVFEASEGCDYVHVAGHGLFNRMRGVESGLRMADGWITASDIACGYWNLAGARLVTLSACETGLSELSSNEDYLGLPGALLLAGVPRVVASLWAVDDESSALLMMRFLRNHRNQGMSVAGALCEAASWLRKAGPAEVQCGFDVLAGAGDGADNRHPDNSGRPYAHPRHWASFVCVGA